MLNFRDLPIRYKLIFISLGISGLILLLSTTAFVVNDFLSLRETMLREIGVISRMAALNSDTALRFDDQPHAGQMIAALRADEHVLFARMYDMDGKPLATFRRESEAEREAFRQLRSHLQDLLAMQFFNFEESERDALAAFLKAQDGYYLTSENQAQISQLLQNPDILLDEPLKKEIGERLAHYQRGLPPRIEIPAAQSELNPDPFDFEQGTLTFRQWVEFEGQPEGLLLTVSDLGLLQERIRWFSLIVISVIAGSVLVAFFLSARTQRLITRPILNLMQVTKKVSQERNYGLRARRESNDELGVLVDDFNAMLQAIQSRDEELARHRDHLENLVAERTAELKKLNMQLTYQAFHDALTNLPNRAMFVHQVEQAVEHAKEGKQMMAMLFLDLDHFKYINDTLGHSAGDRILQEVAKRILGCTRQPEDTVARLGGDEFTVLLRNLKEAGNAGVVADKIIKSLTLPFRYESQDLYVTTSIGISVYPKDGQDVGMLMRNADTSMYLAKQQGRNTWQFYTSGADAVAINRLHMENKLRQAIEYQEFEVWYQPRFELLTGHLVGAEALVRWRNPDLELVPPAQFIPLAEDTGLIIPIGEWVLRTACQDQLEWQKSQARPVVVSVNFSGRQFWQEGLLDKIAELLKELRLDSQYLELELTESLIMPNAEETVETLRALKKLGLSISVDDFGTGYSSLSYLKRFPIDILKIDQSFIYDIGNDSEDMTLVSAIIAMAHKLKLKVVAEGVEKQEQVDFLTLHQCDFVQGFLCGKPTPAPLFKEMMKQEWNMETYAAETEKLFKRDKIAV